MKKCKCGRVAIEERPTIWTGAGLILKCPKCKWKIKDCYCSPINEVAEAKQ